MTPHDDTKADAICAYSGNDKCAYLLSGEHHEQLEVMRARFTQLGEDLKAIVRELKDLVVQNRESQRELIDVLRGKSPGTYVPLSVYLLTIVIAIGVDRIEDLLRLAQLWIGGAR